jgi:hypothetical protein
MVEGISFRQVGREASGRIYKGTMSDAFNRFSHPSIPAKSELLLNQEQKSGEGFGSTANRFNSKSKSAIPGPGQYTTTQLTESTSFSKKGYGGLTSKSSRFKRFQYCTPVPGPGAYTYDVKHVKNNQGATVFLESKTKSLSETSNKPAPGQYDPRPVSTTHVITSTFRSTTKRLSPIRNLENPSPWQYNPSINLTRSKSAQLTSAFKQPVNAKRYQVNLYDPHSNIAQEVTPGPGEYEQNNISNPRFKPSSMFVVSECDRFGNGANPRKKLQPTPGPGAYHPKSDQEKVAVSGAVFMSESERIWYESNKKPPGPAFYKPSTVPKKRSFHLNTNKIWV